MGPRCHAESRSDRDEASEVVLHGYQMQILRGVYPERKLQTLRCARGDSEGRRVTRPEDTRNRVGAPLVGARCICRGALRASAVAAVSPPPHADIQSIWRPESPATVALPTASRLKPATRQLIPERRAFIVHSKLPEVLKWSPWFTSWAAGRRRNRS